MNTWSVDSTVVQTGGTNFTLANITAAHTVAVTFSILSCIVTPSTDGHGTITPSTPQTVNYNGSVSFSAAPNTGYLFNQWLVDGAAVAANGDGSVTVSNVTANHSVEATFTLQTFTVTPSAGAHGAISPSTAQTVNSGSSLTFTTTPNIGYVVASWLVDGIDVQDGGTSYTLYSINAAHSVQVTFSILLFTITPSADPNGTITPPTAQTVSYGSSLTFTAAANTGYMVHTWSVDGIVAQTGGATFALTDITAAHNVQVTFSILTFTITPSSDTNGVISPPTAQKAIYGSSLTFSAAANTGYMVNTWSVDGTVVQNGGTTFTLANITANHMVQLAFMSTTCATPVFNLPSSIYSAPISVTITTITNAATICYTMDGTIPSETNGMIYSGPVTISVNTTLQAIAYRTGMIDSPVETRPYDIQCAIPTITITSSQPLSLTLSTSTPSATICYTLDGSAPTETHGTVYTGPVLPTANGTLKALAFQSTMADSSVAVQAYTVAQCATPTFSLAPSSYNTPQTVSISTTTSGATICYTTDGSTPTETHGTVYTGPLTLSTNVMLQAFAWQSGMGDSAGGHAELQLPVCDTDV